MSIPKPQGWRPLHDNIWVVALAKDDVTDSGLTIPEKATRSVRTQTGIVVAVGPGSVEYPTMGCEVGDLVAFTEYSGQDWDDDAEPMLVVRELELKARIPAGEYPEVIEHEHGDPARVYRRHLKGKGCSICVEAEEAKRGAPDLDQARADLQAAHAQELK